MRFSQWGSAGGDDANDIISIIIIDLGFGPAGVQWEVLNPECFLLGLVHCVYFSAEATVPIGKFALQVCM